MTKVKIHADHGRLRLVWSYQGKRYWLSVGLADTPTNRAIARLKSAEIERDMALEAFDFSLQRYRGAYQGKKDRSSAVYIFGEFIKYKKKFLKPRSIEKYTITLNQLRQFFDNNAVSAEAAEQFKEWLAEKQAPLVLKQRLGFLKSGWEWAVKKQLASENPWAEVKAQVKVAPKQKPRPFSSSEQKQIVAAFRHSRHFAYYADFVEFLIGVGCRPGEAAALRWKHFSEDLRVVWIGESYSRGEVGPTKTNEARFVELSDRLLSLVQARRGEASANSLVFPAAKGGYIDDKNFRNRAWKKVLCEAGVDYRKPYNMRHTFASAALDCGLPPAVVASITGHDIRTLYENYAGNVRGLVRVPELQPSDKGTTPTNKPLRTTPGQHQTRMR